MTPFSLRASIVRAGLSLSLFAALPLFAGDLLDSAPMTADPKAVQSMAQQITAGDYDTVALLDEATYTTESDGKTRTVWHYVQLVVTADGVDNAGTVRAPWSPWYDQRPTIQARVIAKDGSVQTLDPKAVVEATSEEEADMFSDQRVLRAPLPGVVAGSVVESVVTFEGRSPIEGGGKYGFFTVGAYVPTEHTRMVLDCPTSVTPHIANHSKLEPRIVEKEGRRQMIFESGHIDAYTEYESYLPPDETNLPYIAFSTGTSWKEIAQHYSDVVDAQIANNDLKATVATAIGNATDRRAIIDRLLAAVEANVRYAGVEVGDGSIVPRAPKTVLGNKYGDCKDKATLLVAMLRTAGIPAHVALLKAGLDFDAIGELPGVDHFNHAIVAVDGEPALWIDPTDEFARAGELPTEDQGRMALIASANTTALTRTPESPSSATINHETREFVLPEDGKAHVVETSSGAGTYDASIRRAYATSDKTKYRENYEKFAKNYYVAASMEKLDVGEPHDLTKEFHIAVSVQKSQSGVVYASSGEVVIPVYAMAENLPDDLRDFQEQSADAASAKPAKKRVHDFMLPAPYTYEWTYRIKLPAGFAPRTLPQNEKTQLGSAMLAADYSTETDGTIVANVRFDSGKRRLTAAEFEETRKAVSRLGHRELVRIGFDAIGQAKLNAGDIRAALAEFRKMSELHPKEAQHHIELARALLAGGLGEAARDEAKRAVAVEPSNAHAHAALAEILEHDLLGRKHHKGCDVTGAIAELRKAKELEPTTASFRAELASLLTYGDNDVAFGRNARLKEAADEYAALIKDLGKDGKGYEPSLMLVYAHAGRWNDVRAMLDKTEDEEQRTLFRLMSTAAIDGSAAGLRELNAFSKEKRQSYGSGVAETLLALRMYDRAADFMEAASQGSPNASQVLPFVQILRKTRRIDQITDESPRGLLMKMMSMLVSNDVESLKKLFTPEMIAHQTKENDEELKALNLNVTRLGGGLTPNALLDMMAVIIETQLDGNDELGYRLRPRIAGAQALDKQVFYAVKRDGRYLFAAMNESPSTIGFAAMKFVNDGNLEAARTWLNWARESISAGGGDDPLSGPPFARLWQKEKPTATADEIKVAAASLMNEKEFAVEGATALEAVRDKFDREETKTQIDLALSYCYAASKNWAKLAPLAERMSKAYPDSGSMFTRWIFAQLRAGHVAEAEAAAKERATRLPKDHDALTALSSTAAQKGDYEAAESWARKIVNDLTPSSNDLNNAAWLALFRGKDFDQAIDDARRASSNNTANSLNTLAALYAETGKNTEARQALLQAIDRRTSDQPTSADWFVMGRIAENYGVREAAAVAYKKVKQEDPDGMTTWELTQKRIAALQK